MSLLNIDWCEESGVPRSRCIGCRTSHAPALGIGDWSDELGRDIASSDRRLLQDAKVQEREWHGAARVLRAGSPVEPLSEPDHLGMVTVHQCGAFAEVHEGHLEPILTVAAAAPHASSGDRAGAMPLAPATPPSERERRHDMRHDLARGDLDCEEA